jgi:hypothetical protein
VALKIYIRTGYDDKFNGAQKSVAIFLKGEFQKIPSVFEYILNFLLKNTEGLNNFLKITLPKKWEKITFGRFEDNFYLLLMTPS